LKLRESFLAGIGSVFPPAPSPASKTKQGKLHLFVKDCRTLQSTFTAVPISVLSGSQWQCR